MHTAPRIPYASGAAPPPGLTGYEHFYAQRQLMLLTLILIAVLVTDLSAEGTGRNGRSQAGSTRVRSLEAHETGARPGSMKTAPARARTGAGAVQERCRVRGAVSVSRSGRGCARPSWPLLGPACTSHAAHIAHGCRGGATMSQAHRCPSSDRAACRWRDPRVRGRGLRTPGVPRIIAPPPGRTRHRRRRAFALLRTSRQPRASRVTRVAAPCSP